MPERGNVLNVNGVAKAYRVACLEEIGGLRPSMGWDGIDEYGARAHGWHVRVLTELTLLHYRPRGSKQNPLKARWEEGRGNAYMGYLPSWLLVRAGLPRAGGEAVHRRRPRAAGRLRLGARAAAAADRRPRRARRSCAPNSARGSPASSAAAARPRSSSRTEAARHTGRPGCASRDRPSQPPPAGHRRRRGGPRARARPRPRGRRAGDDGAGRDPAPARGLPRRATGRARGPLRRGPIARSPTPAIEIEVVQGGEAGVMWAVNAERRRAARGELWRRAGPTCSSRPRTGRSTTRSSSCSSRCPSAGTGCSSHTPRTTRRSSAARSACTSWSIAASCFRSPPVR